MNFVTKYNKLKEYAVDLGYKVIEVGLDSWDPKTKIICNNKRRIPENRIIYLAHEVGHASHYEKYKDMYFELYPGFAPKGKHRSISEFEQEVLAWDEGLNIAKRLSLNIDIRRFAQIKTLCLNSYK